MADFRKIVVALAVLVFVAGMANAQTFSCTGTVANPPQLRAEGLTELIGDIVLNCTGTGPSGLANITVYLPAPVTSRVTSDLGNYGISESLLLVNEPAASGAASVGLASASGATGPGCAGFGGNTDPSAAAAACTYNTFQGYVSVPGATPSVTFLGVPVIAPGTLNRTYRITNIRVNANAFAGGTTSYAPLTVQVAISGTTAMPVNNNGVFTAGVVTQSKVFDGPVDSSGKALSSLTYQQCIGVNAGSDIGTGSSVSTSPTGYLQFRELFATAFKPRGITTQGTPGQIYNTESGLILQAPVLNGQTLVDARANYGTRLRATFTNIPLGTAVWVATQNVQLSGVVGSAVANSAHLTTGSSTGSYSASGDSWFNAVAATATSGTAIWEIQSTTNTNAIEAYDFPFLLVAVPAPQTTPAVGVQGTVTGNYAPTPTSSQVAAWSLAMATQIPRFQDAGQTFNLVTFSTCQTNLLFPYVLGGVAGFDTGIAITNTSKDPFKTIAQSGTCALNFYGANAPAVFTTPSIGSKTTDSGVIWASTAMTLASGFNGYIIAQCNFQYGHGFAFVSDIGAHNIAMGYLALILPDVTYWGSRPASAFPAAYTAETLGQ